MRKMKATIRFLISGLCLFTASLHAGAMSSFCDSCSDACWEVGGEAIWWKPCHCPLDYATLFPPDINITNERVVERVERVKPSYNWGFRVWVGMEDDCVFANLGWTYLKATDTSSIHPLDTVVFLPTQVLDGTINEGSIRTIRAKIKTRYNKVNLRGGYYFCRGCEIAFHALAGIRYVDIEHNEKVLLALDNGMRSTYREQNEWHGFGLELGIGTDYHIGCGFYLSGYLSAFGALGQQKTRADRIGDEIGSSSGVSFGPTQFRYSTYTQCLPGIEFRLGVNYTYTCGCVELKGEIGYELDHYFGALAFINPENSYTNCEDFGFAGPYISLAVCF